MSLPMDTGPFDAGLTDDLDEARPEELVPVTLRVNGIERPCRVPGRRLLSDALRHDLGLTGTHVGCEHGVCGACTVLLDGAPVRSCLMFAASAQGHEVTTVEGLGSIDALGPVQQAFIDCHGLQCGFCTPGFLTTITAFLEDNPDPTTEEAREAISGNLCRCTGYQNIVTAVGRAAELRRVLLAGDGPEAGAAGERRADAGDVPRPAGTTAVAAEEVRAAAADPDGIAEHADPGARFAADPAAPTPETLPERAAALGEDHGATDGGPA